ncbi:MAG: 4Fe-4S dicluster domain-containing protein, partial [Rhodanobacteraceae bacterium]
MYTQLADWAKDTDQGREAADIIGRCTHCGFCLSACPTFQLTGDELDGPRGRIYQMKLVLEGVPATAETQLHLDRCITCHACETTCPSGVTYGALVDIGRRVVDARVQRPWLERLKRNALRRFVLGPWFGLAYRVGRHAP